MERAQLSGVSVIVPAYNAQETLPALVRSLEVQTVPVLERILVDDGSTDQTIIIAEKVFRVVKNSCRKGPAAARNLGSRQAKGEWLVFFDADCAPRADCIEKLIQGFQDPDVAAVMGSVRIPPSGWFRDSIAALGFPGGGSTGFEKIWRVSPEGFTEHISSLNFAIRRCVFEQIKGFDADFSFSCEDAEFSNRLSRSGMRIRFEPDAVVEHAPEESLRSFVRDHLKRGKGNYVLRRKIGKVGNLIRLRIWSTGNIIRRWWKSPKIVVILGLLCLAFVLQQVGFFLESQRARGRKHEPRTA